MRRVLILLALMPLTLGGWVEPALSTARGTCVIRPSDPPGIDDKATCTDAAEGSSPGAPGTDGSYRGSDGKRYVPYEYVTVGPNGQLCVAVAYKQAGTFGSPEVPEYEGGTRPSGIYPPCPVQPGQPGTSAALWAARYWETIPLPRPNPRIQPDWGITGKWVFLQTQGQTAFTHNTPTTPFGPLTIQAKGLYYVDWGDGENSGPYSIEGKHWPDGVIKHIYINIGSYDITVTERWTATWSFGGQSGVLRELRTTGKVRDYPLRQIQAVIPGR